MVSLSYPHAGKGEVGRNRAALAVNTYCAAFDFSLGHSRACDSQRQPWWPPFFRIGEAKKPGPVHDGGQPTVRDVDQPTWEKLEADIVSIKTARNDLAWRLYRADPVAADMGPVFAEQLKGVKGEPQARKRRRPRIQQPRASRDDDVLGNRGAYRGTPADMDCDDGDAKTREDSSIEMVRTGVSQPTQAQSTGLGVRLRPRGGCRARGRRAGKNVRRGGTSPYSVAGAQDTFVIFFANITSWSKHAADFIVQEKADVVLAAEHHLKEDKIDDILKATGRAGWNTTVGPANQSAKSKSGSNAGVLAQVHGRWHSTPWAECKDAQGHVGPWFNLVGRTTSLNGTEVQVLCGYFDGDEGLGGSNWHILARVEYLTGRGNDPFVFAADFNMDPQRFEVEAAAWLRRNKAVVVCPSNVTYTCKAVSGGSFIDYFVVSETILSSVIDCVADVSVPWGPHFGLRLTLRSRPTEVQARRLVRYSRLHPAGPTCRSNESGDEANKPSEEARNAA